MRRTERLLIDAPTEMPSAKIEFAIVLFSPGKKSIIKLYAVGAVKASNAPSSSRLVSTSAKLLDRAVPIEVSDQKKAARPMSQRLLYLSANVPVVSTMHAKETLKTGPAISEYLAIVKPGMA